MWRRMWRSARPAILRRLAVAGQAALGAAAHLVVTPPAAPEPWCGQTPPGHPERVTGQPLTAVESALWSQIRTR